VEIPGALVSAPRFLHGAFEIEVFVPARANSISISHRGY
jgi:hypothetical protein